MARILKIMEKKKQPLDDLKNDEITKTREKWEMHTEGPGICRENWKSRQMRNTQFRTGNMARKTEKGGKFRNVHCMTEIWQEYWKSWKRRNNPLTTWKMTKSLKHVKNEKCTLKDLEYVEKTENHGKWEIHNLGREIWRGKLKKVENLEMSTVWLKYGKNTENHGKEETTPWRLEKWRNH